MEFFAADSVFVRKIVPSPRHTERVGGKRPDSVILHYTGLKTHDEAMALLAGPEGNVSCHYVVDAAGGVTQLVPETRRAWHAGAAYWKGERDINSASIGIEIDNGGHDFGLPPFGERQVEATIALAEDVCARWQIRPERVLAHSDVAPTRKRDPGEHFPWARLAQAGVGHWVEPAPIAGGPLYMHAQEGPPIRALQALLSLYGYDVELTGVVDKPMEIVVAAFQRHFRPERVDGRVDASTIKTLQALIGALN